MKKEILPIVITGHVDHGKSTLIGALLLATNSLPEEKLQEIKKISQELGRDTELAFIADQLKEERERKMTIETTRIFFKTRKRNYGIIDTPGHAEFLKNMITGSSQAQAAVVIVDVQEGIKEQTRRHLYVIQLLGIKQLIVVLNKMDLINYDPARFKQIKQELLTLLEQLGLKPALIIPVSAKENDNICRRSLAAAWFLGPTLLEALDSLRIEPADAHKPLALPVQDVYGNDDQKIIVGRLSSGQLKPGQKIKILPAGQTATVKALVTYGQKRQKEARAGENIGFTLKEPIAIKRGDIIVPKENFFRPANCFQGTFFWLAKEPLRLNQKMDCRCATQESPCFVEKIEKRLNTATWEIIEENSQELAMNEAGQLLFRTEKPMVAEKFSFIEELGRLAIGEKFTLKGLGIIV